MEIDSATARMFKPSRLPQSGYFAGCDCCCAFCKSPGFMI